MSVDHASYRPASMDTSVPTCVRVPASSPWKKENNQISLTETNVTKSGKIYGAQSSFRSWNSLIHSRNPHEWTYYGLHISSEKTHHSRRYRNPEHKLTPPVNTRQDRQQRTYQRNIEASSRYHYCRRKTVCYICRVCVCSLSDPTCKVHPPYYIVTCGLAVSTILF
jgi:hypothetical protein